MTAGYFLLSSNPFGKSMTAAIVMFCPFLLRKFTFSYFGTPWIDGVHVFLPKELSKSPSGAE